MADAEAIATRQPATMANIFSMRTAALPAWPLSSQDSSGTVVYL
jgi:hypothetical protein